MGAQCVLTGKKTISGNKVSHSNRKTKRTFKANLQWKRIWLMSESRFVWLRLSTSAIRTLDKAGGLEALVQSTSKKYHLTGA